MGLERFSIRQDDATTTSSVSLLPLGIPIPVLFNLVDLMFSVRSKDWRECRQGNFVGAKEGRFGEGREECRADIVVEYDTRARHVANEEKGTAVHQDLLVNVVRERGTAKIRRAQSQVSLTHANSPDKPSSLQCRAANSSGVTLEERSHSNVSVRFCVPRMMST